MKRILLAALAVCLLPPVLLGGWAVSERVRDPFTLIRGAVPPVRVAAVRSYEVDGVGGRRLYQDVTLAFEAGRSIEVTVSLPRERPRRGLPVLVVLGGLAAGRDSLKYVPDVGSNAVVSYAYPIDRQVVREGSWVARISAVREATRVAPAQVVALARWLRAQSWADPNRISLLGYSLGALAVPVVHHMGKIHGVPFGPSILAFGAADLYPVLRTNLRLKPRWLRAPVAWLAASLLRRVDPAVHLPHLSGEFLIISGAKDKRIPAASMRALHALTPEPKTIVILPGEHMNPRDPAVLARVVEISERWLVEKGAATPP